MADGPSSRSKSVHGKVADVPVGGRHSGHDKLDEEASRKSLHDMKSKKSIHGESKEQEDEDQEADKTEDQSAFETAKSQPIQEGEKDILDEAKTGECNECEKETDMIKKRDKVIIGLIILAILLLGTDGALLALIMGCSEAVESKPTCKLNPTKNVTVKVKKVDNSTEVINMADNKELKIEMDESVIYNCKPDYERKSGDPEQRCRGSNNLTGSPLACKPEIKCDSHADCTQASNGCPDCCFKGKCIPACPQDWSHWGTNQCYKVFGVMSADDAKEACKNVDAYIAMPKNEKENEVIHQLAGYEPAWIGLRKEKNGNAYFFPDGGKLEDRDYQSWDPGFKSIDGECVEMYYSMEWKPLGCSQYNPFICQKA